jgi:putative pyoverdin transport system ATP-binding/permease protein
MNLIRFLLRYSPRTVILAIGTGLVSGISSAGMIVLINTSLASGADTKRVLVMSFVGLGLLVLLSGYASRALLIHLSQNAIFDLRAHLSRQILNAPLRFLEKYGAPRLLASLTDDVSVITGSLLGIPALCINFTTIVVCLVYLGWLSGTVMLSVLAFMALGVVTYNALIKRALRYLREGREEQNTLFKHFRSLTQGTKELKLHAERRSAFLDGQLDGTADSLRGFNIRGLRIYAGADSFGQFLFFVFIGLLLFALPLAREVSVQTLTGYTLAILYIMVPLEVILNFIPAFGRAQIALQQVESLGLSLDQIGAEGHASARPPRAGAWERLELSGVAHAYHHESAEDTFLLGPLDLEFEPGELVFLTGGNGSGKTTLVKLLTGLYAPEAGEVRLNGEPVTDENREWYRRHFSVVFSDFYLFESFLGLGSGGEGDGQARDLLYKLQLDHKVQVRDGQLSTTELSQGQRKRLALLTALLEDRPFYIFDEWAADQDPVFKNIFYTQFLPELKANGKTALVITHDDAYYHLADRTIKLDYGKVCAYTPLRAADELLEV